MMEPAALTDLYFMKARSKLIDLAAFLDRVERAPGVDDHQLRTLRVALKQLATRVDDGLDESTNRAEETLLTFSDPTREPAALAEGKAATSAWIGNGP